MTAKFKTLLLSTSLVAFGPAAAFAAGASFLTDSNDRISGVVMEQASTDGSHATPVGTVANPLVTTGAAGAIGSVTAAGTNGTVAQAVQGITGGVPIQVGGVSGAVQSAANPNINALVSAPTNSVAYGVTPTVTATASGSLVVKASAGDLYAISATAGASAGFLLVGNAAAVPADGAVTPIECIPMAANGYVSVSYNAIPEFFTVGIWAAFSTTGCFTKTLSATTFIHAVSK
jgi:hypothetical protein